MTIKHYTSIISMVIICVVFFGLKANASEIYDTNYNSVNNTCFNSSNQEVTCTDSVSWDLPGTTYIWQELYFDLTEDDPQVTIDSIDLYGIGQEGSVDFSHTMLLMDETQFNDWSTGGGFYGMATSTAYIKSGTMTWNFDDDNCVVGNGCEITHWVLKIYYEPGCEVGSKCKTTNIRTANDAYPTNYDYPFYFDGYHNDGGTTQLTNDKDWMFTINRDDTPLSITSPNWYAVLNDEFDVAGTCNENVGSVIENATTSDKFYWQSTCTDGIWGYTVSTLAHGTYTLTATTSYATTTRIFLFDAFSDEDEDYLQDQLDILLGEDGEDRTIREEILRIFFGRNQTYRPWSYINDIYDAVNVYWDSTTTTFPSIELSLATSSSEHLSDINLALFSMSNVEDRFDPDNFTTVRNWIAIIMYAVFTLYLWRRFINLV